MVDEKVKCIDCKNIRRLRKDEKKLYFQCIGFCEGEGGTKTIGDITAERICSRYVAGVNDLDEINAIACGNPVKCLNCKKMTKLPYELATHTTSPELAFAGKMAALNNMKTVPPGDAAATFKTNKI
jgi:hypothetical protein